MPNVTVYLDKRTYWRVAQYSSLWEMGESATLRLIVIKGLDALEKERNTWLKKDVTDKSMKRT